MIGGLLTNSVSDLVAVPPFPSLTDTENEKLPNAVGVPLSNPALDSDRPDGRAPLAKVQMSESLLASVA